MERDLCSYFQDVLRAADDIVLCTGGLDFDTFACVDTVFSTVLLKFLIIGEALHKAEQQFPSAVKAIPDLKGIVGQRNRIVHGYFDIDSAIVWTSVQEDLPKLVKEVKRLKSIHCDDNS